jgi:hypothetical protein
VPLTSLCHFHHIGFLTTGGGVPRNLKEGDRIRVEKETSDPSDSVVFSAYFHSIGLLTTGGGVPRSLISVPPGGGSYSWGTGEIRDSGLSTIESIKHFGNATRLSCWDIIDFGLWRTFPTQLSSGMAHLLDNCECNPLSTV